MHEEQFLRLERLIGRENIEKLHSSRAVICGAGAVGGFAIEALARSGVGFIRVIDFDTVSVTNLNRQILALHSTIGKKKVEVARQRILDINPDCIVEAADAFADKDTYNELLEGADVILDCIDSLTPKIGLLEYAVRNGFTVISSMGAALRRDLSLIRCADISETWGCPLARQVRSGLRKRGIESGIRVVFSPEKVNFKYTPVEEDDALQAERVLDRGRARVILGSLPTVTAVFGEYMAQEALSILLSDDSLKGEAAWNPVLRK